jgi:flavin-dependent dehydrogenase
VTDSEVIIVGGGPAGASCALELRSNGVEALILDKESFPRPKLCAGWITPQVFRDLEISPLDYPHSLLLFKKLHLWISGINLPVPTRQYSIRRIEFDAWLISHSGAPVEKHQVRKIRKENNSYIIDESFRCRFLVGAGGTNCPVYKTFFTSLRPRLEKSRIITMEEEIPRDIPDKKCRLWFFEKGLPGYSWYVPKKGGYLNIGIGGKYLRIRQKGGTIRKHWESYINKLDKFSLVSDCKHTARGYSYYIRNDTGPTYLDNICIIGDAAGIATLDMGEGIGPAVRSGLLAARSIINKKPYSASSIRRFSLFDILLPGRR